MRAFDIALAALVSFLVVTAAPPARASSVTNIQNFDLIARELGLDDLQNRASQSAATPVKIAILDNGFAGWQEQLGSTLPSSTNYHAGPVAVPQPEEDHGTSMAQIITAVLTNGGRAPQRVPFQLH
ncbi:MAG: hypothetical protein NDI61_06320, partial [Bdellovibrionaceae bacterium]|nr:hypothetical protein [Pseudobdellovibrionaceae bacterium]